tara:strand:+ start:23139 stop:23939 length:801 start_codon:yes stop_codon:yes gene_type:complete
MVEVVTMITESHCIARFASDWRALTGLLAAAATAFALPAAAAGQEEWLSLGSKHWSPTVFSKTGAGTENAVAEARVTRAAIEGWCANWSPGDRDCVRSQLATPEAKKTWRATANCIKGRITAVDGNTYTLAGRWDNSDIGGGRTRWRDASGQIVGRDNASGGLGISQQWEVLCPATAASAGPAAPRSSGVQRPAQSAPPTPAATTAGFTVGETVYARYGAAWVRGKVTRISRVSGAKGPELAYNVTLENGECGLLPAHMMRKTQGR